MRKFLITNPTLYEGAIELLYEYNILCMVDFRNTNMIPAMRAGALKGIEVLLYDMLEKKLQGGAMMIEAEYPVSFADFWKKYPNKINKKRSEKLFNSLSKDQQIQAIRGLNNYLRHLSYHSWKECKSPDTYLRNENWNDEYK